jgi:hypothetical protein
VIQDRQFCFLETKIHFLGNKNSFPRIVGNKNLFPTYSIVNKATSATPPILPEFAVCRHLEWYSSYLSHFGKMYCYIFLLFIT